MPGFPEILQSLMGKGGAPGGPMAGGAPPMPGQGAPGMGGPEMGLDVLAGMQQSPPPDGEKEMLQEASRLLGTVASRYSMRSAKAAKALTEALTKIQAAREAIEQEATRPMAPTPDMGVPKTGAPGSTMPGMPQMPPGMAA